VKFKRKQAKERLNMGLDMYAYVAGKANDVYDNHQEIAYWRKHPNLHGWMEKLAEKKGVIYNRFNGVEIELTWDDIDMLEKDIKSGVVARLDTTGFFFGDPSDDYYYDTDLKFCIDAKAETFLGRKVFYNSSW
jgi:hypothetical protein